MNWLHNPITGPTGLFKLRTSSPQFKKHPKFIYKILTKVATEAVKILSIKRFFLITITSKFEFIGLLFLTSLITTEVFPKEINYRMPD